MNTLILSSSLSPDSKSFILCNSIANKVSKKGANVTVVDARTINLAPSHKPMTKSMKELAEKITAANNIVIGMGVHNYSISDSLKILLDTCCEGFTGKFFGIACAAGGSHSYLTTMQLTQICMNEWRMIQLPQVVYATESDFTAEKISNPDVQKRLTQFTENFYTIGSKLL